MFCVNEYVVYGSEGVCRVESVGHPDIVGLDKDKEYYTLLPIYRSGKIYTPVDSNIPMRSAITKEEAQSLISGAEQISAVLDVPRDSKQATQYYRSLVRTYECKKLMSIVKYVVKKQHRLGDGKKSLPAVDLKFMRIAQDMLCGELGFALGIEPQEAKACIERCCED